MTKSFVLPEMLLGDKIKALIKEQGLTQAQLAHRSFISEGRLSNLIRHSPPDVHYSTIKRLAMGFKMPIDRFVYEIEINNPYNRIPYYVVRKKSERLPY